MRRAGFPTCPCAAIPSRRQRGYNSAMSDDHKKPGVAFWATVVLVVVFVYPLSIGPVICLDRYGLVPEFVTPALQAFY
jgi:cobalamin synthase